MCSKLPHKRVYCLLKYCVTLLSAKLRPRPQTPSALLTHFEIKLHVYFIKLRWSKNVFRIKTYELRIKTYEFKI